MEERFIQDKAIQPRHNLQYVNPQLKCNMQITVQDVQMANVLDKVFPIPVLVSLDYSDE